MSEKVIKKDDIVMVPIPKEVVKNVGIHSGSHVEVTDDGYHIILTPVENDFTEEEWKKINAIKKEKGKTFSSIKELIRDIKK